MRENNLVASVALFSELYNSEQYSDISDVLSEFIKGAIVHRREYTFNSSRMKILLEEVYGFIIPESVVRTTLRKMVKAKYYVKREENVFVFTGNLEYSQSINDEFETKNIQHENIYNDLCKYIETKTKKELDEDNRRIVFDNLFHFLMNQNGYHDKYYAYISSFIISKNSDLDFSKHLNSVREGVILYQGINYTADINNLGSWNNELTIFLSPEHLFNSLGYNGELFQHIFNDFHKLVQDINKSQIESGKQNKEIIKVRYLSETEREIDDFFATAESILKGRGASLDPTRPAMREIVNGCIRPSDIQFKKISFFKELNEKNILPFTFNDDLLAPEHNLEDISIAERLTEQFSSFRKNVDDGACMNTLRIFSIINSMRRGINNRKFNDIRYTYMTESSFVKYIGNSSEVKKDKNDTAFAHDIDFVITQFWFTLKKGFSEKDVLPKSFEFITKAKIILSSQLNSSVSKRYDELQDKYKTGELTQESALEMSYYLREKSKTPENINAENIDISLDFLNDEDSYENMMREKEIKEATNNKIMHENNLLRAEIEKYKALENKKNDEKTARQNLERANEYSERKWEEEFKSLRSDFWYLLKLSLPELISILISILLVFEKTMIDSLIKLIPFGSIVRIIIWIVLATLICASILCKKYFIKNHRIKRGFKYIQTIFKYKSFKKQSIECYKAEYMAGLD